ncbi:Gfo/Idh/MocA family oxidoreductase [bacterium]|jgi:predicted dehydrogenase|nr:Gfo/Idh/MocA family oxidoreductase [bacterium]
MISLGLIGCGTHCRGNHAPALSQYAQDHPDRLRLAAVCDLDRGKAEQFASACGFGAAYADYVEMLEAEILDGVVVVMPIELTAGLAIDLMKRGVPTTVEKPMGYTLDEVREIVKIAEETGTANMVSVNRRFEPVIRLGVDWVREQGPIRYVRASILRHGRREDFFVSGTAIHPIDTLREIGGNFAGYDLKTMDGETPWYHVDFTYETGALATLDILPSDGSVEEGYEIYGENYRVDIRVEGSADPHLLCWKENELVLEKRPAPDEPPYVRLGPYAETHEFVTALAEGRPPWPSVGEVFPSVEVAYTLDPSKYA